MRSNLKQVISYNTGNKDSVKYGVGIWSLNFVSDPNKAMNYRYMWPFKYIAIKNFKKAYPKELRKFIGFENILMLSGKMSGMFGGLVRKD